MINRPKGFTLIELIVVVAIIGILVTMVIIAINPVQQIRNSQDARRRSDLQSLKQAMQLYYNDNRNYPSSAAPWNAGVPAGCWSSSGVAASCPAGATIYMRSLSTDPTGGNYLYQATPSGCDNSLTICSGYIVGAVLATPPSPADPSIAACTQIGTATYEVCND